MFSIDKALTLTDKDYKKIDKAIEVARELKETLTALDEAGKYMTDEFNAVFAKYVEAFKKGHGYRPHWVHVVNK